MTKLFTETDLIRYIYGETNETENSEIESALLCDAELNEQLSGLRLVYEGLNRLMVEPSERAIEKVHKFAVI